MPPYPNSSRRGRLARILPTAIALVPACVLMGVWILSDAAKENAIHLIDFNNPAAARAGVFLLPISTAYGARGIALDGGELPFLGQEVPRFTLGKPDDAEPLRVALLTDWTSPDCRETHRALLSLGDSLPHIELFLLPIASTPAAEDAHRAMLAILRTASSPATIDALISEILDGSLAPESSVIFMRLATLDPELNTRLDPNAEWVTKHADTAFILARSQLARNASLSSFSSLPQLTTFDAVLTGKPMPDQIAIFLSDASARQSKRLVTHPAVAPPGTIIRCQCQDPSHRHSLPLAMELQLAASPSPPPAGQ